MQEDNIREEFEKVIKDLEKHNENGKLTEEQREKMYELFQEVRNAKNETIKQIKSDLRKNPDKVEAQMHLAYLTTPNKINLKTKVEKIIKKEHDNLLKKEIVFEDSVGEYWLIYGTRPYLTARNDYLSLLLDMGMIRKAVDEAEDIIRLNNNDNMGVRYRLIHMYAYLEDEESAKKLYDEYMGNDDVEMNMALSILYFKLGDIKKAKSHLIKAQKTNEFVIEFIDDLVDDDVFLSEEEYIIHGSKSQLEYMYEENLFIYDTLTEYSLWAMETLEKRK
ncbi:MAG: hypothetical protein Q4B23_00930 [Helcococcus sp.]|nr:hypothetical protein [Helcococcus sp.]